MSAVDIAALESIAWWLGWTLIIVGGPCLVTRTVQRRRRARIRIRVRHVDSSAARAARHERAVQGLEAGCQRLLAAIPAQRGGERHAG